MKRRITVIFLVLCMTLSLLPCDAFAEEAGLGEDGANTEEVFPEAEFADSETLESPGETGEEERNPVEEEVPSEELSAASSSNRIAYPVEGGNIYFFDSGVITDCDDYVTRADIPAEINGIPVTCIGNMAFKNLSRLTRWCRQ